MAKGAEIGGPLISAKEQIVSQERPTDDDSGDKEKNQCVFSPAAGYFPFGFSPMIGAASISDNTCYWYGDDYDGERISFWAEPSQLHHTDYTRVKKGNKEEWMYIRLNSIQQIEVKEIIYVTLTDKK